MSVVKSRSLSIRDYTVACICPLPVELTPVLALRDERHDQPYDLSTRSQNAYQFGTIGRHNIVVVNTHQLGTNAAAVAAESLLRDFPEVRLTLLVGIGGGVPGPTVDIRLGDVVVSQAKGEFNGVVQYDLGRRYDHGFQRIGQLNQPPRILTSYVKMLKAEHSYRESEIMVYLNDMLTKNSRMREQYQYPGQKGDELFEIDYQHQPGRGCENCDLLRKVPRTTRSRDEPYIHYGLIGSANAVVKSAVDREKLREDLGIICLEMEAAGVMNNLPCLVIRGICDYADSHKNDNWRAYAAAVAAAYMKELLMIIPPQTVTQIPCSSDSAGLNFLPPSTNDDTPPVRRSSYQRTQPVEMQGEGQLELITVMENRSQNSLASPQSPADDTATRTLVSRPAVSVSQNKEGEKEMRRQWDTGYEALKTTHPASAALLKLFGYYDDTDIWYDLVCINQEQAALTLRSKFIKGVRGMTNIKRNFSAETSQHLSKLIGNLESFVKSMRVLIEENFAFAVSHTRYRLRPGVHTWLVHSAGRPINPNYYWFAFDCIAITIDKKVRRDEAYVENDPIASHAARLTHEVFKPVTADLDPMRLDACRSIAAFLSLHVRDDASAELYRRVLLKGEKVWEPQNPRAAEVRMDLGQVYMDQGKYEDAKDMLKKSLRLTESRCGSQSPRTLAAADSVGVVYSMLGRYDKAEKHFAQALTIAQQSDLSSRDRLDLARFQFSFGQCRFKQGKFDSAAELVQSSMLQRREILGPEHQATLTSMDLLAQVYFQKDEPGNAILTYKSILEASKRGFGLDHPRTIYTSCNLALMYLEANRLSDAEDLLISLGAATETHWIVTKTSPLFDLDLAFGCLYIAQGNFVAAEQKLNQALFEIEAKCGPDHIGAMWTRNGLGTLYLEQGKVTKAEKEFQHILEFCRQHRAPSHQISRKAKMGLDLVHQRQGRTNGALELHHSDTETG